jgi:hypothetical protein
VICIASTKPVYSYFLYMQEIMIFSLSFPHVSASHSDYDFCEYLELCTQIVYIIVDSWQRRMVRHTVQVLHTHLWISPPSAQYPHVPIPCALPSFSPLFVLAWVQWSYRTSLSYPVRTIHQVQTQDIHVIESIPVVRIVQMLHILSILRSHSSLWIVRVRIFHTHLWVFLVLS